MCGLSGGWSRSRYADLQRSIAKMNDAVRHRGPDDEGYWSDGESIVLAHRRLSIVDLSSNGHQPMISACGRRVIVFNGEIYNHLALRKELELVNSAPKWRGHSDTETFLACIARWGIEGALERSIGMFAFAIWDRLDRSLCLARDRFGEKPLYYGWNRGSFLFCSELESLRSFPCFDSTVDRQSLAAYVRYGAIPAPRSIYRGIQKLSPGHILHMRESDFVSERIPPLSRYWSPEQKAADGRQNSFGGSESEAADALESILRDAIRQQMIADVPIGAFLSGGVDSSLVSALMQTESARPVRTFSIGFHDESHDEAPYASAVARHLGTDHTEMYVTPENCLSVIPDLSRIYDEPFADSSQIPTILLSRLASRDVRVALSGDGGDEIFGGYSRYFIARRAQQLMNGLPIFPWNMVARGAAKVPVAAWDHLYRLIQPLLGSSHELPHIGDKIQKAAMFASNRSDLERYDYLISYWDPSSLLLNAEGVQNASESASLKGLDFEQMMLYDTVNYLPNDVLVKVDRAAMSCSLETRIPLLDHRIYEFAWSLPISHKIRNRLGKRVLRQVLYRHVPKDLIDRPKKGFSVPIGQWLRGPLKEWASALLDRRRIEDDGYFNPDAVTAKWTEHQSGLRNWQHQIWAILMFQSWLDERR